MGNRRRWRSASPSRRTDYFFIGRSSPRRSSQTPTRIAGHAVTQRSTRTVVKSRARVKKVREMHRPTSTTSVRVSRWTRTAGFLRTARTAAKVSRRRAPGGPGFTLTRTRDTRGDEAWFATYPHGHAASGGRGARPPRRVGPSRIAGTPTPRRNERRRTSSREPSLDRFV